MGKDQPLAGQVALITGGSRGIGFAIARTLGTLGASVAISGRTARTLEKAAKQLHSDGISVSTVVADVSKAADVERMIQHTRAGLGEIDILVNNAGAGVFGPFFEHTESDWNRILDTNLKGVFLCSRAVVPQMMQRRSGHIINISSLAGKNIFPGGAIYCASKWGLQGLSGAMAEDLRSYGIRVSVVCPGSVHTDFSPHTCKDPKKLLQPEDVAHVVAMLVTQSPQSFVSEVQLRPTAKP